MSVEDKRDQFREGMRVLAVDDDPICLKVLEGLLRKCNYHVTTTDQAFKALEILRRNRNKYDLVISDVNMPEMDGFKLLELLGIEMDLPVIMLSGYSNVDLVMKGIDHGACDYMLKPVRVEELKNIWQHVVRKKKTSRQDKACDGTGQGVKGDSDHNGKLCKKRKRNEEEEREDDEHETKDSSRQKKRMVWTKDLKMKFVAAVNELGGEKGDSSEAKPKKILELMRAEGVSRENVSSHLQKYRQHPEKVHNVALGGNASYMRMSLLDGFRDMQSTAPPNQSPYILPASPALPKLNPLQQSKCINQSAKSYPINDSENFRVSATFQDPEVSFFSNQLMLQGIRQQTNSGTCAEVSFDIGVSGSSNFLDYNRCSENLHSGAHFSGFPSNTLPMSEPFNCHQMHNNNSAVSNSLNGFSAVSALSGSVDEIRGNAHERLIDDVVPTLNYMPEKRWEELERGYNQDSHQTFNTITSHTLDTSAAECSNERNSCLHDQLNGATPIFSQSSEAGKSSIEMNMKPNEDHSPSGSLDDILNVIWKAYDRLADYSISV